MSFMKIKSDNYVETDDVVGMICTDENLHIQFRNSSFMNVPMQSIEEARAWSDSISAYKINTHERQKGLMREAETALRTLCRISWRL